MKKSSLLIIFLVVFIDLVGFGIVIPILPYYAQTYGASGWTLGLLMTCYSLMQFLVAPVWGRLSDHIGRRPVLLISILGTSISLAILGMANSLTWLFIGRTFAGICGANISTAYAYISDVTSEKDRAKGMGLVGAAFGLGFIFGPAIGGLLSRYGFAAPMFASAALALLNFAFALARLEEPNLSSEMRAAHRSKRFDLKSIQDALGNMQSRGAILLFFMVTFALAQMEALFALYMGDRYSYTAESAGVLFAVMGLIMATVQGGLIGRLVRQFGEKTLIISGTALCSCALFAFASTTSLKFVIMSITFMALGHGVLHPSLSSLASLGAHNDKRGATMGVFQSAGSLARVLGPPLAGWLYDTLSWQSPFFSSSAMLALACIVALTWRWEIRKIPLNNT